MSRFTPVKGLVGSWLTPDRYQEGGALRYKVMGRTQIHDSIAINTINLPSCSCALPVNLNNSLLSNVELRAYINTAIRNTEGEPSEQRISIMKPLGPVV